MIDRSRFVVPRALLGGMTDAEEITYPGASIA